MAGPFTHILVCQSAAEPLHIAAELQKILDAHQCYLLLGAVSPDLPAIWDTLDKDEWSHIMHAHDGSNSAPFRIFHSLRDQNATDGRLAWLFGYVAHIVTDAVVHPVVNLIAAKRHENNVHQISEIRQDALCFKEMKSYDLKTVDFLEWLEECHSHKYRRTFDETMDVWDEALEHCYKKQADSRVWYFSYMAALHLARWSPFQFRGYTYPPVSKIGKSDRNDFYAHVSLPTNPASTGAFKEIVFQKAVAEVRKTWSAMWNCRLKKIDMDQTVLPDFNLNNGTNRTSGKETALWQG